MNLKKLLLTGTLGLAFAASALTGGAYLKNHQTENFHGGSRDAVVETSNFLVGTTSSLKLLEDGEVRVAESHIRLFKSNAADVQEARTSATTWVNAPEPEIPPASPIPF